MTRNLFEASGHMCHCFEKNNYFSIWSRKCVYRISCLKRFRSVSGSGTTNSVKNRNIANIGISSTGCASHVDLITKSLSPIYILAFRVRFFCITLRMFQVLFVSILPVKKSSKFEHLLGEKLME